MKLAIVTGEDFVGEFDCDTQGLADAEILGKASEITGQSLTEDEYSVVWFKERTLVYPTPDHKELARQAMAQDLWRFFQDEYDIATKGHLV